MTKIKFETLKEPRHFLTEIIRNFGGEYSVDEDHGVIANRDWEGKAECIKVEDNSLAIMAYLKFNTDINFDINFDFDSNWINIFVIKIDADIFYGAIEIMKKKEVVVDSFDAFNLVQSKRRDWIQKAGTSLEVISLFLSDDFMDANYGHLRNIIVNERKDFIINAVDESHNIISTLFDVFKTEKEGVCKLALLQNLAEVMLTKVGLGKDNTVYEDHKKLREAYKLLVKDMQSPPKLNTLARVAGMNHVKFQAMFKQTYGQSFYQYYQKLRYEYAKSLLESGEYNVGEAALAIGYKNVSHFGQHFEKHFSLKPHKFLKSQK